MTFDLHIIISLYTYIPPSMMIWGDLRVLRLFLQEVVLQQIWIPVVAASTGFAPGASVFGQQ